MNLSSYHSLDDVNLVARFRNGDQKAFAEIYRRYAEPVYRHVLSKIRSRDDARDIIQELFASLWLRRAELAVDTQILALLFTAAKYRVINYINQQQYRRSVLSAIGDHLPLHASDTDHLVRERELGTSIENAVSNLPAKMQTIFRMSRQEQLSHKQIAKNLNLSETTVKKQVANALKILKPKITG
ncbi:RNA polymerase sigma factor [Parapedobacter deserti]|uniref:RNA polymerase sigma factor n=1 Tax=Parapedobacter deserti TaxID=1912957 RepID=A0ABV7JKK2_9SPHI